MFLGWDGDFECHMNRWDEYNSCSAAEQASDDSVPYTVLDEVRPPNQKKRKRKTGLEGGDKSRMMLIPLDPVARISTMEAFHLPEIDENLYVGSAEVSRFKQCTS